MTIRKGSSIIAGNSSNLAGDWIDIDNGVISAKGSTNTDLEMPALYCWYNSSNDVIVYTTSETPTSPITLYDSNYNELTSIVINGVSYPLYTVDTFTSQYLRIAYKNGNMTSFFDAERTSASDITGSSSDNVLPTQKAVKTYVDDLDSDTVHLTGTETISGNKIMAFNPLATSTDNIFQMRCPNAGLPNRDTITTKNNLWSLIFCDNNNDNYNITQDVDGSHRVGLIETVNIKEQDDNYILMRAYKPNTQNVSAQIMVGYDANNPYTQAPTPTDTTSTNSHQIATVGWMNTRLKNYKVESAPIEVYPLSNSTRPYIDFHYDNSSSDYTSRIIENEAGALTFTSSIDCISGIYRRNNDITQGTAPSSAVNTPYYITDKNGKALAHIYHRYETDKTSRLLLQVTKANSSTDSDTASISVCYPPTGNAYAIGIHSDVNGSIVTTYNKSKNNDGYFRFGNGLIIQWGKYSFSGSDNNHDISFPIAFPSYGSVSITRAAGSSTANDGGDYYARGVSTTGFNLYRTSTNTGGINWIAVGY